MKRNEFLKQSALLLGGTMVAGKLAGLSLNTREILGTNHIPNPKTYIMKNTVLHKAETRGHANHGWLDTYHTFSFSSYHNPERMRFGVLRVLNDDTVAPGMGFGTHPHDNMEIISIPLEGDLEHKDSMGNTQVIRNGDIQVMSAGTGIYHSEFNRNKDSHVKFLQIWVLPNKKDVTPRYDQITLNKSEREGKLQQILSPNPDDAGVWIHQNAWFHLGNFKKGDQFSYSIKDKNNGIYTFILSGAVETAGQTLHKRDGIGVWETEQMHYTAVEDTEILIMEVPMN